MSRPRILVVGSAIVDHVATCPYHPGDGETVVGNEFAVFPGGKGLNQAVAVARLGGRATLCSAVGDDANGRLLLDTLEREGVQSCVAVVDRPTGAALISVDERGQNRIVVCPGACGAVTPLQVRKAWDADEFDAVLVQLEVPFAAAKAALGLARANHRLSVLNPAPAPAEVPDFLHLADVLTPNEVEAFKLTGVWPSSMDDGRVCAQKLFDRGMGRVVVTLGESGCLWASREHGSIGEAKAEPVRAVDATAAGDVFSAALTVRLALGDRLDDAALWANRAAGLSVTRAGAVPSIPRLDEL